MQQELGHYKGKATSLMRDVELNYNQLSKTSTANQMTQERAQHLQTRISQLEADYETMRQQRNDAQSETTRLQT